jgi:hypothetical protein
VDFPACQHRLEDVGGVRWRAERRAGADHRVDFVDEENEVRPLLDLADHILDAILEHAAQHRACHHRIHLEVDDLAVAQPDRNSLGLELEASRKAFGDGGLTDARLTQEQHGVRALAMAEDLEHLIHLDFPPEDGRNLVLSRELVQVRREVLEERRKLETLLEPLVAQLVVAHARGEPGDDRFRLDPVAADDRHRDALRLLEDGREEIRGFDRVPARSARVQERELEEEPRRGRHAELLARDAREQVQVLFEGLEDFVRVEVQIPHHLAEHVPLDLGESQAQVLVGELDVLPSACLVQGAVHDALGRLSHLVLRNVEVLHWRLPSSPTRSKSRSRWLAGGKRDVRGRK